VGPGAFLRMGDECCGKRVVAPLLLLDGDVGLAPPWWWGRVLPGASWSCQGGSSGGAELLPV
jgi:hypothetical protein